MKDNCGSLHFGRDDKRFEIVEELPQIRKFRNTEVSFETSLRLFGILRSYQTRDCFQKQNQLSDSIEELAKPRNELITDN